MAAAETLSKQQKKSNETKKKILKATRNILKTSGYEALSVKNICHEAGVSNGSFFHHFKTKDDLLSYYMQSLPGINPDLLARPSDAEEVKTAVVHIYLNYGQYLKDLGLPFVRSFFTPDNQSLNPDAESDSPYPIVSVEGYLSRAAKRKVITLKSDLSDICTDIRMIVIGNIFEWCLKSGEAPYEKNIRRSLSAYLDSVIGS